MRNEDYKAFPARVLTLLLVFGLLVLLYTFYLCILKQQVNVHLRNSAEKDIIPILDLSQFKLKLLLSRLLNQTLVRKKETFICIESFFFAKILYYIDLSIILMGYLQYRLSAEFHCTKNVKTETL